ncbi:MAG TPA: PilZ domain-containing protein [Azospirillaceae bacterium]|nr:PilZ domain-containing protein [Azospirillaceae bacterium]
MGMLDLITRPLRRLIGGDGSNRRVFDRDTVDARVTLALSGRMLECTVSDVSPGGAFLASLPEEIPIGTEGVLEVPETPIRADFRVVRHAPGGAGIVFLRDGVGAIVAGWTKGRSPAQDPQA